MNFQPLDDFFKHLTEEVGVPSVECAVHQGHKELYRCAGGYGYKPEQNLYNLYSVTKPFTCTAALQLFERGKFLLNDPLSDYMPEFKSMTVKRKFTASDNGRLVSEGKAAEQSCNEYELVPCEKPILVKNLFTMSAGFNYDKNSPAVKKYMKETDGSFPTRCIAKALSETPLDFEPGEHWQYSLCHDVLGAFIEVVSGMSFGEYLRKNIFEPLGMSNTGFERNDDIFARMADQYRYNSETGTAEKITKENEHILGSEYESGGAGLYSCVDDYILFADALANGGVGKTGKRILSPATIELMRTNQLCGQALSDLNWKQLSGYGYGLGVRTALDKAEGGILSPVGEFGWGGAAGAYVMIDPENNLAVYYAQHMLNNLEPYIHPRIRNIVYSCL